MTTILILFLVALCYQGPSTSPPNQDGFTQLTGPYLGQTPPGSDPVLFAPGLVSVDENFEHSGAVFSPDGTEVYWAAKPRGSRVFHLYFMRSVGGRWTTPRVAPFTERYDGNRPAFSPDGRTLYFETARNPVGGPVLQVTREGDGWSDPAPLPATVNATETERVYGVAADGSLYFGRGFGEEDQILVARLAGGQFSEPVPFGPADDSPLSVLHAFVSPDEDYMILEGSDHSSNIGLTIRYRRRDGSWTDKVPLPFGWARFPVVSPDGRYLFFMGREGIYWVSTSFVEELRLTR
jgi:Tol biopolymer transport system component